MIHCRHVSIAMMEIKYCVRGQKLISFEKIMKELLHMLPNVRSNLIDTRLLMLPKGPVSLALSKHTQP